MKKRPNILIIASLLVGIALTIIAQYGFVIESDAQATIFGIIGVGLIVGAIVLMYIPLKD